MAVSGGVHAEEHSGPSAGDLGAVLVRFRSPQPSGPPLLLNAETVPSWYRSSSQSYGAGFE